MRYFVTGFGPFGEIDKNPSSVLARRAASVLRAPFRILPVSYVAVDAFLASGEANEFDALLMLGFAARSSMTPELLGHNLNGPTPDVDGVSKPGKIDPEGPEKLLSTLWTAQTRLPAGMAFSEDAGGYLCNHLLYRALRSAKTPKAGFLHIPGFDVIPERDQLFTLLKLLN